MTVYAGAGSTDRFDVGSSRRRLVFILAVLAVATLLAWVPTLGLAAPKLDRNQRPTPGPVPPVVMPKIVKVTLSNGLPVWVVTRHELPTSIEKSP